MEKRKFVIKVVDKASFDPNYCKEHKTPLIILGVRCLDFVLVEILLTHGANPNTQYIDRNNQLTTPLLECLNACDNINDKCSTTIINIIDMICLLGKHGADFSMRIDPSSEQTVKDKINEIFGNITTNNSYIRTRIDTSIRNINSYA